MPKDHQTKPAPESLRERHLSYVTGWVDRWYARCEDCGQIPPFGGLPEDDPRTLPRLQQICALHWAKGEPLTEAEVAAQPHITWPYTD